MAQTAAHLVDHVIPPVPMRQWVISVPKRLRGFLADRPAAVRALTKIFLAEIERLLCAAAGATTGANTPTAARPRLGAVSFLHRFGSALNRHVHLHACVTDGVFMPPAAGSANDAPPAFLPARPITQADLAALTERVRRRLILWFRRTQLLDAAAAADMLGWENSGFSIDASVRIALVGRGGRACGGWTCIRQLLQRDSHTAKTPLARHVADRVGQAHGAGGGGVSTGVSEVRRRHPAQRRRPAGAGSREVRDSQAGEGQDGFARVESDPHTSWRTARAASAFACSRPAHRLG